MIPYHFFAILLPMARIDEEAEDLITLGKLLRKKRSESDREIVEEIIARNLSLKTKIEKIRRIDKGDHYLAVDEKQPSKRQRQVPKRKLRNLIQPFIRESYFSYLFRHRRKMKAFGERTGLLKPTFLPPGPKLTERAKTTISHIFAPFAEKVQPLLNQLMGNAWLYLTKKEYNLLVFLEDYCSELLKASSHRRDQIYLMMTYGDKKVDSILSAIHTLIEHNRREIPDLETLPAQVKGLLAPGANRPGMNQYILAELMARYRRYLEMEEVVINGIGDPIEGKSFLCNTETGKRIEEYLQSQEEQLKTLNEERKELLKLRYFLKKSSNGDIDQSPLDKFYSRGGSKRSYQETYEKPISFMQHLIDRYMEDFESLLIGKPMVENIGRQALFADDPFHATVSRLKGMRDLLADISFQLPSFNRDRFLELHSKKVNAIPIEAEAVAILEAAVVLLKRISSELTPLLFTPFQSGAITLNLFSPIELFRSSGQGEPPALPMENTIHEGGAKGLSIRNALEELTVITQITAFIFGDREIHRLLSRESSIKREQEKILKIVERIADTNRFLEIREKFTEPGGSDSYTSMEGQVE